MHPGTELVATCAAFAAVAASASATLDRRAVVRACTAPGRAAAGDAMVAAVVPAWSVRTTIRSHIHGSLNQHSSAREQDDSAAAYGSQ